MAMTQEDEFLAAFNADQETEEPMTEDVGTDMTNMDEGSEPSESAAEGVTEGPADAVTLGNGEAESMGEMPAEDAIAAEAEMEGEPLAEEMAEEALSPEDMQRQKSWEGRLKKREEELAAREAAGPGPQEEVTDADVAEIQRVLAEDFGEDFVKMIMKLAAYEAKKMAGESAMGSIEPLAQTVNDAIAAVQKAFQSQHFAAIKDAHEDFSEVVNSPEFVQWIGALPDEQKAKVQQVIEAGSPGQVIRMLNEYKASLEQGDAMTDAEDAASSVRGSAPVNLPSRAPASGDDEYARAWDQL